MRNEISPNNQNHAEKGLEHFEQIFHSFYSALCFFANRYTNDKAVAEDIAQEAFIRLWDRYEQVSNHKAFLYATVRNACLNHLRGFKSTVKKEHTLRLVHDEEDASLFENTIKAEMMQAIMEAMKRLPPQCQKVYELLYKQGMSMKEAAVVMHLSISAIKQHKAYGLMLLRKMLGEHLGLLVVLWMGG